MYRVQYFAFEDKGAPGRGKKGGFFHAPAAGVVDPFRGREGRAADNAQWRAYALFFHQAAAAAAKAFLRRPFPAQQAHRRKNDVNEGLEHASG
jgi:hypothetical protein